MAVDTNPNLDKLLEDVSNLQNTELESLNNLSVSINSGNISKEQLATALQSISDITNMRTKLYGTLGNVYNNYNDAYDTQNHLIKSQKDTIDIIEQQINTEKEKIKKAIEDNTNKIRIIEIDNYYINQYKDHSQIVKILAISFFLLIIIVVLNKLYILPLFIYNILFTLIMIIGGYKFIAKIYESYYRDTYNYNKFYTEPPKGIPVDTSNPAGVETAIIQDSSCSCASV
jgi:NACalpha-BTF3-like transcription factor